MLPRVAPVLAFVTFALTASAPAAALVWPDVADRVERDLTAADPGTRRAAARALRSIGPVRGSPLAIAALGDPDDEVRLAAADAAIRLRAPGAADAVSGWLNAPDVRMRRKACEVTRALPSPRAVAPLARTLGDPDADVRSEAAEALGHQASSEAVAPLLGHLDDPTPAVRIHVVGALARLGDERAVVPLVGKVEDSSPDVRQSVVRALGDLGDPRASSALVLALRDQNTEVRGDAITALGRLRIPDAVDGIAPFVNDSMPTLRVAAIDALGRIATPDAVRVLMGALGVDDDAAGGLGPTPAREALVAAGPGAVPSLEGLLAGSPSPRAATSAAWVLGALRAHDAAAAVVLAMRRGTLPTAAALHALAGAGTGAHIPVVLEFVADRSPVVRAEALAAASALLDPALPDGRAVEPLAAALRDPRPTAAERAEITALLGRTGAPRAAPLLVELAGVQDLSLRLAAIDALGALGPTQASPVTAALLSAIDANDPTIRLHGAVALSEAGGEAARDELLKRLDGDGEVDRAAVLTALGGVLERTSNDVAIAKLATALALAAGPERDAVIEAIGRAPRPSSSRTLASVARSEEAADRRAAATMCAAHSGDADAIALARTLLGDPDPSVVAQAAWSLGSIGAESDIEGLLVVARAPDGDSATNATAAIGRIAARTASRARAASTLCPLVRDERAFVRANALVGLARSGARCGDGSLERAVLAGDPAEDTRSAAVLAISRNTSSADGSASALDRCARNDPSSRVAERCRESTALGFPARTHSALVYVVPDGSDSPRSNAAYAMLLADGSLRAGTTDRRGAVFEPFAPEGDVSLRRPSP